MEKSKLIKYFFLLSSTFIYIYDFSIKYSLRKKILLKGRKFLNKCLRGKISIYLNKRPRKIAFFKYY